MFASFNSFSADADVDADATLESHVGAYPRPFLLQQMTMRALQDNKFWTADKPNYNGDEPHTLFQPLDVSKYRDSNAVYTVDCRL